MIGLLTEREAESGELLDVRIDLDPESAAALCDAAADGPDAPTGHDAVAYASLGATTGATTTVSVSITDEYTPELHVREHDPDTTGVVTDANLGTLETDADRTVARVDVLLSRFEANALRASGLAEFNAPSVTPGDANVRVRVIEQSPEDARDDYDTIRDGGKSRIPPEYRSLSTSVTVGDTPPDDDNDYSYADDLIIDLDPESAAALDEIFFRNEVHDATEVDTPEDITTHFENGSRINMHPNCRSSTDADIDTDIDADADDDDRRRELVGDINRLLGPLPGGGTDSVAVPEYSLYEPGAAKTVFGETIDGDYIARVYSGKSFACYDTRSHDIEVFSFRSGWDDGFTRGLLPQILAHEHLHHVLHEVVGVGASRKLDRIDSISDPLVDWNTEPDAESESGVNPSPETAALFQGDSDD